MSEKKEIIIELVADDKISMTVRNLDIDCVIKNLNILTTQLGKDRDFISSELENNKEELDLEAKVDKEDLDNLLKPAPEFPSFDDAYAAYKRGLKTTKEAMDKYGVPHGTIPDSVGKVLSILSADNQIREDMARLVSGYITNESFLVENKKRKKKK